jgi:hypothetical protein
MELLADVGHVESHFFLFGDCCYWCKVGARFVPTYYRLRNHFGRTWRYSLGTRLKWKFISFCLKIVLILTQDSCTVRIEHAIGLEIVSDAPDGTPR